MFYCLNFPIFTYSSFSTSSSKLVAGMIAAALSFLFTLLLQLYISEPDLPCRGEVSIAWQLPQILPISVAEVTVSVTGLEFAYSQAPPQLRYTFHSYSLTHSLTYSLTQSLTHSINQSINLIPLSQKHHSGYVVYHAGSRHSTHCTRTIEPHVRVPHLYTVLMVAVVILFVAINWKFKYRDTD